MNYKKYDIDASRDFLNRRKWAHFLASLPVGRTVAFPDVDLRVVLSLRARISQINGKEDADRTFFSIYDYDTRILTVETKER